MKSDPKRNSTDRLPLPVYAALVGLVAWMALAAWGFAGPGYADLSLAVVTLFLLIAVGLPFILWRVARANRAPDRTENRASFSDWMSGQFETWQDRVKGRNAAIEIALPIAAAAAGMTAFAIVFHYAAIHAGA